MKKLKFSIIIITINWLIFITTLLIGFSPLGHMKGPAEILIVILVLLTLLTVPLALVSEIILVYILLQKNIHTKKPGLILLILNSAYLAAVFIIVVKILQRGMGI